MTQSIPRLLTVTEVAEQLGVSASYLNKLRCTGGGPEFVKFGTRVGYDPQDLVAWIERHKQGSTTPQNQGAGQ